MGHTDLKMPWFTTIPIYNGDPETGNVPGFRMVESRLVSNKWSSFQMAIEKLTAILCKKNVHFGRHLSLHHSKPNLQNVVFKCFWLSNGRILNPHSTTQEELEQSPVALLWLFEISMPFYYYNTSFYLLHNFIFLNAN